MMKLLRFLRHVACAALGVVLLLCGTVVAMADTAPALPDPLTPAAVDALVSRLSDAQVRDLLLTELGRQAAAQPAPAPASFIDSFSARIGDAAATLATTIRESPAGAQAAIAALRDYIAGLGGAGAAGLAAALALAIALGYVADRAVTGRLTMPVRLPALPNAPDMRVTLGPLRHLSGGVLGAFVAFATGAAVASAILPAREARVALAVLVWLVFVPRLALELMRLQTTGNRLLPAAVLLAAVLTGVGETLTRVAIETGRTAQTRGAGFWLGTTVFALMAAVVWFSRGDLRARLGQEGGAPGGALLARTYLPLALFGVLWTWFASTAAMAAGATQGMQTGRHAVGLSLLLDTPLFDRLIRAAVRATVRWTERDVPMARAAAEAAFTSGVRIARVLQFGAVVLVVAALWDISRVGAASAGVGEALARRTIGAILVLLTGYVLWELIRLLVNRRLLAEGGFAGALPSPDELDEGQRSGAASRLATILPPLGFVAQVGVSVIAILMALDVLGVNITPLLAGAGVAGIALGFGAQKLVADVVSGVFFLIEDAFRANEYVNAGGIEGTVERLSIRSLHLRQSDGALNCIPCSNVSAITNMSRDWATMKQVFTVPFDTDLEKVRKIFKRIGQDLMAMPEFAPAFILPFKYKGVGQVNDVGILVRGKFMFRPELSQQFLIQREIFRRVQADFAKSGITFARREIRVVVDGDAAPSPDAARGAAAAAALPPPGPDSPA